MRLLTVLLGLMISVVTHAQQIVVTAHREGEFVVVEASVDLPVPAGQAWQTVTDYERLPSFIPDMSESHVLMRKGNQLVVEQKGSAVFLLIRRKIEVRLEIEERPFESINSKAVSGSFRAMEGRYDFVPIDIGTRFKYSGRIAPDFWIPDLFETKAVKHTVEKQFAAMVSEIMRRSGVWSSTSP